MKRYTIFDDPYFCVQLNTDHLTDILEDSFFVPDRLVVVFVDGGSLQLKINEQICDLCPSQMLLLHPKQQVVMQRADEATFVSIIAFSLALQDVVLKRFSVNFFSYIHEKIVWNLTPRISSALRAFYNLFEFNYINTNSSFSNEIANSLFSDFIQMFYVLVRDKIETKDRNTRLNTNVLGGKFFMLLNDNYKHEHSVAFYAGKLCISSKYLTQIIKQMTNITPKDIIDKRLGMEALFLLTKTSLNIQEISFELGFPDQSYFGRFFKRLFGISPMKYRLDPDLTLMEKLKVSLPENSK